MFEKIFSEDDTKKAVLNAYIYNFSVGYDSCNVDDVLDIHKNLIIKHDVE